MPNDKEQIVLLTQLNDDCIRRIFSYLPTLDKWSFLSVCQRFHALLVDLVINKPFPIEDLSRSFPFDEANELLSRCGQSVKQLQLLQQVPVDRIEYYNLISNYCPNINTIEFSYPSEQEFPVYERILKASKHIETLRMKSNSRKNRDKRGHFINFSFGKKLRGLIGGLVELKHLQLIDINDINGNQMEKLNKLEELDVSLCRSFDQQHFVDIVRKNKLKMLGIAYCSKLKGVAIAALVESQTELEVLTISDTLLGENFNLIAQLNKLRSLNLYMYRGRNVIDLLAEFIRCGRNEHFNSLQFIENYGPFMGVTDLLLPKLLQFRNLRILKLPEDEELTDCHLEAIAENLTNLQKLRIRIETAGNVTTAGLVYVVKCLKNMSELFVYTDSVIFHTDLLHAIVEEKWKLNKKLLKIYWDWRERSGRSLSMEIFGEQFYLVNRDLVEIVPVIDWNKHEELLDWDDPFWG